ncbi:hypothetical protein [Phascolarctobacterium sp.]
MPIQSKNPIEKLKSIQAQLAELNAKYKRREKMIQDQKRSARGKLEAARTHAIIQGSTYVTKALGMEKYYNITLDDLMKNDLQVPETVKKDSFDFVFAEYRKLMTDLGDFFYNRPDIVSEIHKALQIRKSNESVNTEVKEK